MLTKLLLAGLSRPGPRGRLSVLIFHRVLPRPDPLLPAEMDASRFDEICRWLCQWFNVLPLDEAVVRLQSGTLPSRALAITFDDGYADNRVVALPILQRHGLSATFFIATGFLDGRCMWNDIAIETVRRAEGTALPVEALGAGLEPLPLGGVAARIHAVDRLIGLLKYRPATERLQGVLAVAERARVPVPRDLMMRPEQVREMRRAGMGIGAHTVSHPILKGMRADDARQEVAQSRETLQSLLGEQVTLFAYPNGRWGVDLDEASVDVVRDLGFAAAFSTDWGSASGRTDPLRLPRFTPWNRTRTAFGLRLASNLCRRCPPERPVCSALSPI